ncbi:hypothetical protein OKW96_10720 [Sphingobacterium sp. KU25419]|nr:hypothetical protein OKW96_10720 [Sphingobacterium sp. KU25419]
MKIRYFIPIICLSIFSCQRDRIPKMEPVDLNLNLRYASEELNGQLELNTAKVTVTNLSTKVSSSYSPQDAAVSIENLKPGNYDIDASITISKEKYTQITGLETAEDVTFNVSFKKYNLIRSTTLRLELVAGTVGDFVIKQVYYAGSDQKNGHYIAINFLKSITILIGFYMPTVYILVVYMEDSRSQQIKNTISLMDS